VAFKGPFQPKPFYDSIATFRLAQSHKVRDAKQILSNTVHVFGKNYYFSQPQAIGKKKIHGRQRSVSLQNKPGLLSIPVTIIEGIGI